MEIPTKVTGVKPAISVLLSDSHSDQWREFRCVVCGSIVFSYNNDHIRMLLASGHPATIKPGTMIECRGHVRLYSPEDIYRVLYQVVDAVYSQNNLEGVQALVAQASAVTPTHKNVTCGARYFVS